MMERSKDRGGGGSLMRGRSKDRRGGIDDGAVKGPRGGGGSLMMGRSKDPGGGSH